MSHGHAARRLKVARSTIQARLERLETTGIIAGYTSSWAKAARGARLRATMLLTIEPRRRPRILTRLKAMPEVERAFTTSGGSICCCRSPPPRPRLLDEVLDQIGAMTGVRSRKA
jgi:DNA-binding Lrp family transcriptional regulator